MTMIICLFIFLLLVGVLAILAKLNSPKEKEYSYKLQKSILTEAELAFWTVLREIVPADTVLIVKPRLADIFTPAIARSEKGWIGAFNKINKKHIDFLLINNQGKVLLGIELDDQSHKLAKREERDVFVDGIFKESKLPILHIPVQRKYEIEKIKDSIVKSLKAPN